MKRISTILVLVMIWKSSIFGQLLTVGQQKVDRNEFITLYKKNMPNADFSERSLNTYMNLLINYELKIQAANDMNIEQLPHIQNELKNYAAQQAQPYLTDSAFLEDMLEEAYERSLKDVHARQIMVRVSSFATPQDTLKAYRIALNIRQRLVKGEKFDLVAKEETEKSDAVQVGNNQEKQVSASDLRYFSAFAMPYNIEKFAFDAEVGAYSMPLRTDIGYHIVQVIDRQPTLGRINASRIFLGISDESQAEAVKRLADSLYYLITGGIQTFEEVARQYSDDKHSAIRGGRMAEFNVTRANPNFIAQLYNMPIEVVSRPFRVEEGYHIAIIHSLGELVDYEDLRPELLFRMQSDPRMQLVNASFSRKLRQQYKIVEVKDALKKFAKPIDSTEVTGFWEYIPDENAKSEMVKVGSISATYADFGRIIENNQMDYRFENETFMDFLNRNYQQYIDELLILNETETVAKSNARFIEDYNAYRDAVLAFEVTDINVWKKSSADTNGLYAYYESQKHCFMWPARIQALIFGYDVRKVSTEEVSKFLKNSYRRRLSADQIIDQANKTFDPRYVSVTLNVYEPGQNKIADRADWTRPGLTSDIATGTYDKGFMYIYNYYPATCKSLEEVRSTVVSQYQELLENQWIAELRQKYDVQINEAEFRSLIKK